MLMCWCVSHGPHDDLKVGARLMCLYVSHASHDDLKVEARLMYMLLMMTRR